MDHKTSKLFFLVQKKLLHCHLLLSIEKCKQAYCFNVIWGDSYFPTHKSFRPNLTALYSNLTLVFLFRSEGWKYLLREVVSNEFFNKKASASVLMLQHQSDINNQHFIILGRILILFAWKLFSLAGSFGHLGHFGEDKTKPIFFVL